MTVGILTQQQPVAQAQARPWRLVHDLRHGRRACDIRIGDYILLDSGMYEVKSDGRKGRRLYAVQGGAS